MSRLPMNLVVEVAKTNSVHYALRLGSRVEALTTGTAAVKAIARDFCNFFCHVEN